MPIHRHSDSRMIRRSQQGDRDAFVALTQRYDERLRGMAYALLASGESLERVMRGAYLKAWRNVTRAEPAGDPGAWLYRTVYNACIDELRGEGDPAEAPGDRHADGRPPAGDPLVRALAALPPEMRIVVVLVDREGFSLSAVGRIVGLDPDVLDARLTTARARLVRAARRRPRRVTPRPEPRTAQAYPDYGSSRRRRPRSSPRRGERSGATKGAESTEPRASGGPTQAGSHGPAVPGVTAPPAGLSRRAPKAAPADAAVADARGAAGAGGAADAGGAGDVAPGDAAAPGDDAGGAGAAAAGADAGGAGGATSGDAAAAADDAGGAGAGGGGAATSGDAAAAADDAGGAGAAGAAEDARGAGEQAEPAGEILAEPDVDTGASGSPSGSVRL